jgi:ankyrin repeat-rich membrane spanning protein
MVSTMIAKMEDNFGTVVTRLCRTFYNRSHSHSKFRRFCCIPTFLLLLIVVVLILGSAIFFRIKGFNVSRLNVQEQAFISTIFFIIALSIVGSSFTWLKILCNVIKSPKSGIMNVVRSKDKQRHTDPKVENLVFKLKREVDLIAHTVKTIDAFTHSCTRLVIVIDGLDSCEQAKVLQILEIVHVLFTREGDPFISILAVDPHVLIKGIEGNLTAVFRNGSVSGHDYLRTIIHMPIYLQIDLSKAKAIAKMPGQNYLKRQSLTATIGSSQDVYDKFESENKNKKKKKVSRASSKPVNQPIKNKLRFSMQANIFILFVSFLFFEDVRL